MNYVGNRLKFVNMLSPLLRDNQVISAVFDRDGSDAKFLYIVLMVGATDIATTGVKIQDSANNSDWNDLYTGTSLTATDDNKLSIFQVSLEGKERYVRLTATNADGTLGANMAVLGILTDVTTSTDPDIVATYGADVFQAHEVI